MEEYFDDIHDYWFGNSFHTERKSKLIANDSTKHYPNKNEAKELRKIMASTGLTEEQVRAIPAHRKALSIAQKAGQKAKRSEDEKFFQDMIKNACKISKQAPQHPETLKVLDELLDKRYNSAWGIRYFTISKPNAKTVVKNYAK